MADVQSNIQVSIDTTQALASIKNLQRQISAFHTSMAQSGAAANSVTAQMQQNLINSINATGKFSAQMRTIKTTTESFTDSLQKNKFSLGEYFRYAGGASRSFGRLFKTEFETINKVARENVKDLQTQYIKMGRDANGAMKAIAVRPLSLDMNDLATKTMIASEKQALLNQLLKQGSTNLLNFGKNTQWAGRQLMVGFTIPLMAVGSAAAKTFMDMETQAIRFKKVYGDLFTPASETKAALEGITELGKEFTKYGIAVSQTVGLAAEAAAAGFQGLDLQRQTSAATKLSILGQVESQKALETTIALQNAFSMSSENLAESIDFLNAVENQTVLSLDDMSTAIPKAAPVVQQLGGDVKDLAFLMTAMKEGGINASEGANALKSGLASLINPTGKANDMLLSFGINAKKIVENNRGNLKKTVIDFASALNELDPLNRAQVIEQMFGKFQFARLSTLFANVTKDGTQAARVLDLAGASVQELASLSEKELGMTAESAMNKFKGAVENLKLALVPVGEEFLKAVTPVAEFVTKILEKFNGLSDGTKKIIVTITAIVAGLGPVFLMTFGLLANGLANIIKGFTFLKTIFNKAGQSTATLGTEVKYMTLEQRNAAAVAASLDQVHRNLAQTFTAEASAVDALTRAYQRSIAAQSQFVPSARPMVRGPITKRAEGKPAVVGGTGNKDSELSLLMPGETVIPTKMSKKYGSLINGMITDSIPGYSEGKLSMYPEFALRLQDAAENMGQRSGATGVPNVLAPLALRIGEARGIAPTQGQIDAGSFDSIYDEYEDITTQFVDKLNSEYTETFKDIQDENERMQKAWSSAGKHVEEQVGSIKSETEKGVVRKTFGLDKDEYGTIPTDSREVGGTKPNRARRGAFKAKLAGYRSYTAIRPGAKRLFERKTKTSAKNLQMGHVYGPIEEDISTLQADPRRSGAVASAAKILDRGKKDGAEYKKGVESSTKDPYVTSLDRSSPHPLAAKHGKEDGTAYQTAKEKAITQSGKARRVATRPQGPAPIGPSAPSGTGFLPIVSPLTDAEQRKESKRQSRLAVVGRAKSVGRRVNSFGGGMGLLGANMGLSMLPDFAGKGIAQGGLAGANLGMMFGPYGMAAGAAIGLVSTAISGLIEKQKQLKAMNEATFKSSSDVATFFGNTVVDTTLKVGSFTNSIRSMSSSAEGAGKSFGYTNEELARFVALIESLPENNPLRELVDGLADQENPQKIIETANAFIATQVAIGQLKPEQAQKQLDLLLASSGHLSLVGTAFVTFGSQVEAITQMLKNAAGNSTNLGNSLIQLTGAAANSSSLEQMKLIIDGIAAAGVSGAAALTSMYNAYLLVGNTQAATGVKILRNVSGITGEQTAFLIAAAAKGFSKQITSKTTAEELVKEAQIWLDKNKDKIFKKTGGAPDITKTKAYKAQEEESAGLKKQIDLLKKKKKIIDNQIKQQEKITNELKRQNDYINKQRDLDQQIVEAKIKGNYIEAASLLQEKNQNTVEFNQETEKSKLQQQADALQAQIDELELANSKIVDAINKSSADQAAATAAAASSIVDAIKGGYSFDNGARARRNRSGQPFAVTTTPAPANTNTVGGPTVNQTVVDPKTGKRVMLQDGYFSDKLSKYTNSRSWKKGDVLFIGKDGDIPAIITNDVTKPKRTGSIEVTAIDQNTGVFQYRVKAAKGGYIQGFEPGGKVSGPGTATSDSIPALLSDGEYVIKASSVAKYGTGVMDSLNAGRFANGGKVGKPGKLGTADSMIRVAESMLGYKEGRGNESIFGNFAQKAYGLQSRFIAWCGAFINWAAKNSGVNLGSMVWTPGGAQSFMKSGKWTKMNPARGDLAFMDFPGDGVNRISHVGLVRNVLSKNSVSTIEGNTSGSGSQRSGGGVHAKVRQYNMKNAPIVGFGRPSYKPVDPIKYGYGTEKYYSADDAKSDYENNRYTVTRGDTLSSIAKKYGVSVKQLIAMNPELNDPKYMGGSRIFSGTKLNIKKFAQGGKVTSSLNNSGTWIKGPLTVPRQRKPGVPYSRSGAPIGNPFGQHWGELSRFIGPRSPGMDIWGGTEIPGLNFSGSVPQHSDYMHQMLEQPRKPFSSPGMGVDRDPMRLAGSGASMGGIGNGAYGLGALMFANGGLAKSKKPDYAHDPNQSFWNRLLFGIKYKDPNVKITNSEVPFGPGGIAKILPLLKKYVGVGGNVFLSPEEIKAITAAAGSMTLGSSHTLFRGTTTNLSHLKPGDIYDRARYMSTSLSEDAARMFSYTDQGVPSLIKIITDGATKGIDINKLGLKHGLEAENEILLGAGKFKVLANEMVQDAGRLINKITMESIPKFADGGLAKYKIPSYEVGSPYIPEDQIAQLHKGERVLTAQENKNFSNPGPVTNNITINGADKDPKQIAQEVMIQLERMQSKNNKTNLVGR